MKYLIPKEAAEKWGISTRRVQILCAQGRIKGAERHGRIWMIPETAERPADARVKSGRREEGFIDPTQVAHNRIISRPRLTGKIAPPGSSLTYIHADAGYGKTTLLMQYAREQNNAAWLSLDERDRDMTYFLRHLENVFRRRWPRFGFYATDLLPFAAEEAFVNRALSALLGAIGRRKLVLIVDDAHEVTGSGAMDFLIRLANDCPQNLTIVMAGRYELWSGLLRLKLDGRVAELTKEDLCFSREETEKLWGFFDETVYEATEGWALALQSYRMAARGTKLRLPESDRELHRYLMEEIFRQLPENLQHFLLATAWLPELDPVTCDSLLNIRRSREILDELVYRNLFTTQISFGVYRYHPLFAAFLRRSENALGREVLRKAMLDCFVKKEYEKAADYGLLLEDGAFIHECINAGLGRPFGRGRYRNIKGYFDCMKKQKVVLSPRVLLARGLYLSSQGRFYEADQCLKEALPKLGMDRKMLLQVMTHKARILRNKDSIEESSHALDSLLPLPEDVPMEDRYLVMIEKIHNLTLSTRLSEALKLTLAMAEQSGACGDARVKAWFERYLTAIYFYRGDYLKCIHYYEKSLSLSEEEQDWLSRHSVGAYAAKAYQVNGQGEKAVSLMEEELSRLRRLELHEELGLNYLMYAEILLTEEIRKFSRGDFVNLSSVYRYLELGEEHVALNQGPGDYMLFAKVLRMGSELLIRPEKALHSVKDVLKMVANVNPFFQALAYGRAANVLFLLGQDVEQSKACYWKAIEIGERNETLNLPIVCYGELAAVFLREGNETKAEECARRCLELSQQFGQRYHFQLKTLFGEVLKFALDRGITPDFTREMLDYGGYATQRVYIHTLGTFYVAPEHDRRKPVKIRTRKSRELLAYLLEHREGVSRERIYADLWPDSEGDIIGMFHTRRGEIRRVFESLGAKNPIVHENGLYWLSMDEIVCDHDIFRQAAEEFRENPTPKNAQKVVDHYTGRYLDDMEALWAESTRLRCEEAFLQAAEALLESYRESG